MKKQNNSGFTLLEIIIVIIIVGVLASLALPRFFSMVEYSKSTEALAALSSVRQSIERCYLMNPQSYAGCGDGGFGELDLEDPANSPNAHFDYTIGTAANAYTITAKRNAGDGGDNVSLIVLTQELGTVVRSGTGVYSGIK
ncbi:MAG: prepilin-type N-terminal cleavage/methylation domain-containing protein [Candidatus Omnitrophica bacterium]|nr:prepilin-type N-terminal cleavage/methylation domain-containing protein [Candidatus Omnitrophota bacterium]